MMDVIEYKGRGLERTWRRSVFISLACPATPAPG